MLLINFFTQSPMKKESSIQLFEAKQIRSAWNEAEQKWYFSIVDVIEVLTGTDRPRKYWNDLKTKLEKEGSQLSEKIGQLKMLAEDGKMRDTDVADTEQMHNPAQSGQSLPVKVNSKLRVKSVHFAPDFKSKFKLKKVFSLRRKNDRF